MVSFASRVKTEIVQKRPQRDCCTVAAMYAVACFSKYFDDKGLVLQTEHEDAVHYVRRLFRRIGVSGTITKKQHTGGTLYEYSIAEPAEVKAMHSQLGTTGRELNMRILPDLFVCQDCLRAFLSAAFLCCGTVTDPQKSYQLEFLTQRYNLSQDMEGLLAEHHYVPHRIKRKNSYSIYIKASEHIADLLTYMGAPICSMELMERKAYKSVLNHANRLSNCDNANIVKSLTARSTTRQAIETLQKLGGMDTLPENLKKAAELRLAYPEDSLAELANRFEPPLSKSGLAHRIKAIERFAQELENRQKEEP